MEALRKSPTTASFTGITEAGRDVECVEMEPNVHVLVNAFCASSVRGHIVSPSSSPSSINRSHFV